MKYRDSVWDRDHVIENMLRDQIYSPNGVREAKI